MAVNLVNVTTINRAKLYQGQPTGSFTTLYTVPASTDVKITSIVLCNVTALPATVTLAVVTAAGTAGITNEIVSAMSVNASQVIVLELPIYMSAADFIAGLQGTANAITVTISGETYA